jgi:hypothetical protein
MGNNETHEIHENEAWVEIELSHAPNYFTPLFSLCPLCSLWLIPLKKS